ncbi:MMPL family transporter [Alteromonas gilva]|uniref:MMPL family transporter n=1 Tax=Alteromonas gilva TaxID=2987522 RepID=A0ABT5KXF9_9ALTE|nr:MMPL family transporter [Alteromonas gilva]MDC8829452.1 MMPL family transporter [Alteromonas gilva]
MKNALLPFTFILAVFVCAVIFVMNAQHFQIDTNLNDLNPTKINEPGLKKAVDNLTRDISQRFVVVIKSDDKTALSNSKTALQAKLNALTELRVIEDDALQNAYLDVLSDYRFYVLSADQRQALTANTQQQIADNALRKLYQIGDGIRLIPFEQDPLGWFSDYLLTSIAPPDLRDPSASTETEFETASFSVMFDTFPNGMSAQQVLYAKIQAIENQISQQYNVTVLRSGMFFFAVDSAQSAKADIQLIAVGSVAGVLLLMMLVFRSLLPLFLSLTSIAIGVGFGVITSTLVFGSIHVLTIVFGASLIGIVVDYSLHYFYHHLAHRAVSGPGHADVLFRAMLLSMITSLVGYGALSLSDLVILKKIALFSCSGLAMAWLSVMLLGPLVIRRPIEARQSLLKRIIYVCQRVTAQRPRLLGVGGLIVSAVCAGYIYAGNPQTNDDPRRFFHVSGALLSQEQEIADLTQIYEPGRYLLIRGDNPEAIFSALDTIKTAVDVESHAITSVADYFQSPQQQLNNYALQAKLYEDGGALDSFSATIGLAPDVIKQIKRDYQFAAGNTLRFNELLEHLPSLPPLWFEHENSIYSFALIRKGADLPAIEAASKTIDNVQYVNTLANASKALKAQRETGTKLLFLAYALIALLIAVYYRKLSAVMLLLIPASASLIAVAIVSAMGQSLNVFHIMALFLVLGLGMDYIIFAKEMAGQQATTHQAILLSAVTSLLSFGLLAFSSMPIVQAFGSIVLIGNTINFIAAISLFNNVQNQYEKGYYGG